MSIAFKSGDRLREHITGLYSLLRQMDESLATVAQFAGVPISRPRIPPDNNPELETYVRELNEAWAIDVTLKKYMPAGIGGELNIAFPIGVIASSVLEQDMDSVVVQIPSGYKHLEILITGRVDTQGGTANKYDTFYVEVNGDTGANYQWNTINGLASSVTASQDLTANALFLGDLQTENAAAGLAGIIRATIPHYNGSFKKSCVGSAGLPLSVTDSWQWQVFGQWQNTAPITQLSFRGNTLVHAGTKIVTGSVITVLGIR